MLALFGNFNLDFPSRFTYSDVKEVGDSSFVLCFAKFKASKFARADSFQNNRFQCGHIHTEKGFYLGGGGGGGGGGVGR